MISVLIRRRAIRFTWPCGCWVAFASDRDVVTPFLGDYEEEDFLAWRLADLHRWRWVGEGVCLDSAHGWEPEQKRELRARAATSRVVEIPDSIPDDELQTIDPLAHASEPIYALHSNPTEIFPCQ
jgi:hypothetical protein